MKPTCSPTPRAAIKKAQARQNGELAAQETYATAEADGDDETKEKRAAATAKGATKGKS